MPWRRNAVTSVAAVIESIGGKLERSTSAFAGSSAVTGDAGFGVSAVWAGAGASAATFASRLRRDQRARNSSSLIRAHLHHDDAAPAPRDRHGAARVSRTPFRRGARQRIFQSRREELQASAPLRRDWRRLP